MTKFTPVTYLSKAKRHTLGGQKVMETRMVGGQPVNATRTLQPIRFSNHSYTAMSKDQADAVEGSEPFQTGAIVRADGKKGQDEDVQPESNIDAVLVPGAPAAVPGALSGEGFAVSSGPNNPPVAGIGPDGQALSSMTEVPPAPVVAGLAPPAAIVRPEIVPGGADALKASGKDAAGIASKNDALAYFEKEGIDASGLNARSSVQDYKDLAAKHGRTFTDWK